AMAAEIGTMRVTEQIDALSTLSTNPFKYLIAPRLIAGLTMLPLLVLVADIIGVRSEEHTSELQSRENLVCRLLLEKKKDQQYSTAPPPTQTHHQPGSLQSAADYSLPRTVQHRGNMGAHRPPDAALLRNHCSMTYDG